MKTFLFKVKERFVISDRGLVLTPGVDEDKIKSIKTGTEIRLVKPDKSEIKTLIIGISFNSESNILLPLTITKDEVPVGTEVWVIG
jgi:hypothetical protein